MFDFVAKYAASCPLPHLGRNDEAFTPVREGFADNAFGAVDGSGINKRDPGVERGVDDPDGMRFAFAIGLPQPARAATPECRD